MTTVWAFARYISCDPLSKNICSEGGEMEISARSCPALWQKQNRSEWPNGGLPGTSQYRSPHRSCRQQCYLDTYYPPYTLSCDNVISLSCVFVIVIGKAQWWLWFGCHRDSNITESHRVMHESHLSPERVAEKWQVCGARVASSPTEID